MGFQATKLHIRVEIPQELDMSGESDVSGVSQSLQEPSAGSSSTLLSLMTTKLVPLTGSKAGPPHSHEVQAYNIMWSDLKKSNTKVMRSDYIVAQKLVDSVASLIAQLQHCAEAMAKKGKTVPKYFVEERPWPKDVRVGRTQSPHDHVSLMQLGKKPEKMKRKKPEYK